jgi:hypothetical protein
VIAVPALLLGYPKNAPSRRTEAGKQSVRRPSSLVATRDRAPVG